VHRQLLQLFGRTERGGGCGRDQHNTGQTGGPAPGERLGDLAAHGMSNQYVLGVSERGNDRLGIVRESFHIVRSGRVRGVAPTTLVVGHESLVGVQTGEHGVPGTP
jgi:hypothetical protein